MSTYPLAQTIRHFAFDGTQRDSRGNVIDSWADPVDVKVYGWYISSTHEPQIAGHDRLLVDAQVLAPESFRPGPKDLIELPGFGEYAVNGETEDYNHGPFSWRPGNVVNLRRITG